MALPRSQLSPRIQNAREKIGANGKMLWWKWCDAPFGESRAWKSNIGGWLTGCGEPGLRQNEDDLENEVGIGRMSEKRHLRVKPQRHQVKRVRRLNFYLWRRKLDPPQPRRTGAASLPLCISQHATWTSEVNRSLCGSAVTTPNNECILTSGVVTASPWRSLLKRSLNSRSKRGNQLES